MVKKLATSISAAVVLAMAVSFAPESASAQEEFSIGEFSGNAVNTTDMLEFGINTSIDGTVINTNEVRFPGAIQQATYKVGSGSSFPNDVEFNPGELKASLISLTPELLNFISAKDSSFDDKFQTQAVKYKARLENSSNQFINFEFYAPYIEPFTNLNSLSVFNASNLTQFLDTDGKVVFPRFLSSLNGDSVNELSAFSLTPARDNVTKVPEPAITASLLGFGIVSTALLRKRHKRLEASLSNSKKLCEVSKNFN